MRKAEENLFNRKFIGAIGHYELLALFGRDDRSEGAFTIRSTVRSVKGEYSGRAPMIAADDKNGKILYEDQDHKFIWLGADPEAASGVVQTNQYLIIDKGKGVLLDPGGIHLFARVVAIASRYISLDRIDSIFFFPPGSRCFVGDRPLAGDHIGQDLCQFAVAPVSSPLRRSGSITRDRYRELRQCVETAIGRGSAFRASPFSPFNRQFFSFRRKIRHSVFRRHRRVGIP